MCSFYLNLEVRLAPFAGARACRQAPYTRGVGLKSEVPFVTPHSHIHSAFASQLPPWASPSCEISLLVVFKND